MIKKCSKIMGFFIFIFIFISNWWNKLEIEWLVDVLIYLKVANKIVIQAFLMRLNRQEFWTHFVYLGLHYGYPQYWMNQRYSLEQQATIHKKLFDPHSWKLSGNERMHAWSKERILECTKNYEVNNLKWNLS